MSDGFNDIDFEKVEIIKGETPDDIVEKCYNLCQQYLVGIWRQISLNNIEVNRVSGGFSNQIYWCSLKPKFDPIGDEPKDVVIRIYGKSGIKPDFGDSDINKDLVISLIMSENGLGPKVYGFFPDGELQQYYKHRHFRVEEQKDPEIVREVAMKLARLHSTQIPIKKNDNSFIMKSMAYYYENAYKKFSINDLIEEHNCDAFKTNSLNDEMVWIVNCVTKTESPVCFTHNDFRGNNIMVNDFDINDNYSQSNDKILFCDFETASYGYRGLDFGTIFGEWNRGLNGYKGLQDFPTDSTIKPFIDEYIKESTRIWGNSYTNDKINSYEQILKEVKVFTLVSNMFMLVTCLFLDPPKEVPTFTKKFLMMGANIHFKNYIHLKNLFLRENSI